MLSRKNRIERKNFGDMLSSKKTFSSPNFFLRVGVGEEVRVAVSVSKKVSKKAVDRNALRRRTYSVVSKLLPNLKNGLYLISAKPNARGLKGERLEKEITKLLLS